MINTSFKLAPWADYLYACDEAWWTKYHGEALKEFSGEFWTQDERARRLERMHHVHGERRSGLCRQKGKIHFGGNSGYQAINLAYHFGATRMILLGYDMQRTGGRSHWHGDHPSGLSRHSPLEDWVVQFRSLAADLKHDGIGVVNASRETALTCFERKDLEAALVCP